MVSLPIFHPGATTRLICLLAQLQVAGQLGLKLLFLLLQLGSALKATINNKADIRESRRQIILEPLENIVQGACRARAVLWRAPEAACL